MNFRKVATLAAVVIFASSGDVCLARGMRDVGEVSLAHIGLLLTALLNPWILLGICLLIGFFASYLSALSFADLTYVLPATSIGYVFMALLAKILLHEQVSSMRWVGIVMITLGVGFVAGGPALTVKEPDTTAAFNTEARP